MSLNKLDSYCDNYGFTKDESMVQLAHALSSGKPDGIAIDIYASNTYMLLLRAFERHPVIEMTSNQLTICKSDGTSISNILLEKVDSCISKWYNGSCLEMVISIYGLCYQVLINFKKSS